MIEETYDNTRLSSYLNCETQGYYAHGYKGTGIISREPSVALAFGLGFHAMAETWCNQLFKGQPTEWSRIQETFRAIWDKELPGELTATLEMTADKHSIANAMRLFKGYAEKFPPSLYQTIEVEKPFKLPLGVVDGVQIYWAGILDRIVKFQEGIYYLELKTTSHRIDEKWLDSFKTSGQMRGYVWAGQQLLGQEFASTIVHGVEKAAIPKTGRARKVDELIGAGVLDVLQPLLNEWIGNTLRTIERIHRIAKEDKYGMNLGDACNAYNFSGCPYRRLCGNDPGMRQQIIEENFVQRRWDPLAEQRSMIIE